MRIGLAQAVFPPSAAQAISTVQKLMKEASDKGCDLVCFPESIVPGLRGVGYAVETYDHRVSIAVLKEIAAVAKQLNIVTILPMEWKDNLGLHIVAFVISENGEILGYQSKNQIDPAEERFGYVPGEGRCIFQVKNLKFGIVICHEGWRYPETVRWAAGEGADIVFHPQFTGVTNNHEFYEGALLCRGMDNNIYFASVNYALPSQGCTTTVVSPSGQRLRHSIISVELNI